MEALARREPDGSYRLLRLRPLKEGEAAPSLEERPEGTLVRGVLTEYEPGTRYTLNLLPFGAYVRMAGEEDPEEPRSLAAQPKRWRLAVLLAGPLANLLVAFLLLTTAYVTGVPERAYVTVVRVEPGSAAAAAGLLPGDRIVAIDDVPIEEGATQVQEIVRGSAGRSLALAVIRDGEQIVLQATPRLVEDHGYLGIEMNEQPDLASVRRYPLLTAATAGVRDVLVALLMVVQIPRLLAAGTVAPRDLRPVSAVGINSLLTFSLQRSLEWHLPFPALHMAGMISLFLGLSNLLPLPALDGGRVLFVLLEAVRGRRIRPEVEAAIHNVGLLILLGLTLLILVQDLVNPLVPWGVLGR